MTFRDRQGNNRAPTGGNLDGGPLGRSERRGLGRHPEGTGGVSNRQARRRARPLPKGTSLYTPGASPARQATERRSAKVLIFLHQLPTWILPLVMVVLLITGLAVKGPGGAVAFGGVAVVLGWLAAISWPRLSATGRLGRILGIAVVLALAGLQATR